MDADMARDFVERMHEEISAEPDRLDGFFAPQYVSHGERSPRGGKVRSRVEMKRAMAMTNEAFPDGRVEIGDVVASGGGGEAMISYHYRFTGTHRGNLAGLAPTHRRVDFMCMCAYRLSDGWIVEGWSLSDAFGLFEQLGVKLAPKDGGVRRSPLGSYQTSNARKNEARKNEVNGWAILLAAFGLGWLVGGE